MTIRDKTKIVQLRIILRFGRKFYLALFHPGDDVLNDQRVHFLGREIKDRESAPDQGVTAVIAFESVISAGIPAKRSVEESPTRSVTPGTRLKNSSW